MDQLIALNLVNNRVFMSADHKEDPVRIPQGKDPYVSACTLSQYYYDAPANNAVLIIPASEPWLTQLSRTQLAEKQNIKVQRVINPCCAAALTDLYRTRKEGLTLAVAQWDRTVEAVLLETEEDMLTVLAVEYDTEADETTVPNSLRKLLKEAEKKPEEITRVILVEDARKENGAAMGSLRGWTGSNTEFVMYGLQDTLQGAYHYGAGLMGKEKNVLLVDALPSGFGVRTVEGFRPIIRRNDSFPCTNEIWVYPQNAAQTGMDITIQEEFCSGSIGRIGVYQVDLPASGTEEDRKICIRLDVDANRHFFMRVRDARNQPLTVRQGQDNVSLLPAADPKSAGKDSSKNMIRAESREAALEFLDVYDTLQMAMDYPSGDPNYLKGISQTLKKMEEVFSRFGVEFYGMPGDSFDPRIHEAVTHTASDRYGKNQVIRILKKGVIADGKIIRFAMVQVAN